MSMNPLCQRVVRWQSGRVVATPADTQDLPWLCDREPTGRLPDVRVVGSAGGDAAASSDAAGAGAVVVTSSDTGPARSGEAPARDTVASAVPGRAGAVAVAAATAGVAVAAVAEGRTACAQFNGRPHQCPDGHERRQSEL